MAAKESETPATKKTVFFINHTKYETTEDALTPRVMLRDYAKEDPAKTTLAHKHGNQIDHLTNLDQSFELKNGTQFAVFYETPTTVS